MIEFGKTLRQAREAKGYTTLQLAEMTRMMPSIVEDLENENFSRIAAPIYGRGFVKLYCQAVGLEPKPLIDEYMEIQSGNRETGIRERKVAAEPVAPEPPPEPVVEKPQPPPPPAAQDELFQREPDLETPAPAPKSGGLSRYATPLRDVRKLPALPPAVWRLLLLAALVLGVVWAACVGVRALYRATTGAPAAERTCDVSPAPAVATEEETPPAEATSAPNREPQKVAPLYID